VTGVEAFRPGADDAAVLALRAAVWGADHPHADPAFLGWLLGPDNPAGPGGGVIVRRGGRAVGFAGLCPRLARLDGRDVRIAHGLEYMVDPALGGGLAGRLALRVAAGWAAAAREQGFAFGINYPNENSRRILTSARLGWRPTLSPRLMARALSGFGAMEQPTGALVRLAARLGLSLAALAQGGRAALARRPGAGAALTLDPAAPRDARMIDALWRRVADMRRVGLRRDAAALGWRYAAHPLRRYAILGWAVEDNLKALIVTTERALHGLRCLMIVDALIDPSAPEAVRALIAGAAAGAARGGGALALAEAAPGCDLARALAAAGFVATPRRLDPKPFMLVTLPLGEAAAFAPADWRFAWGDMDVA